MRVLLIEDDSAMARSIELMLRSEGLNVYTTDLGEEGIDLGKLYDYDIIVLDLQLPDMSGFEVLKALRAKDPSLPVLIAGIDGKADWAQAMFSHTAATIILYAVVLAILFFRPQGLFGEVVQRRA